MVLIDCLLGSMGVEIDLLYLDLRTLPVVVEQGADKICIANLEGSRIELSARERIVILAGLINVHSEIGDVPYRDGRGIIALISKKIVADNDNAPLI